MVEQELSDKEFKSFRDLIAERAGIYFEPGKQDLLRANLLQRMEDCGLRSFADYFQLLSSPAGAKEFDHLLNLIIIPETSFFRDQVQFRALEHSIIPGILQNKTDSGS